MICHNGDAVWQPHPSHIAGCASIRCSSGATIEAPIVYLRGALVNTARDGSPGSAVISGDVQVVSGGVAVPDADVTAGAASLLNHLTSGMQPGSGQSGAPCPRRMAGFAVKIIPGVRYSLVDCAKINAGEPSPPVCATTASCSRFRSLR
ncbi:hypothetical protein [Desulfovibrio sp. SGI.169]|uniref:hypothetical protein n=1 Tax=Desulfovibrio sp. SGI.169 TaxID=3420561 RepID=UPI003CFC40BE